MRPVSKKTAARNRQAKPARDDLIAEVRRCELCGRDRTHERFGQERLTLSVHEIARGPTRLLALDQRYALLVLCWRCHRERIHEGNELWPEARQLAVLKQSRPQDHDLNKYNKLKKYGPDRITEEDVAVWEKTNGPT